MHRTNANRLGVAVQLCFLRHPGRAWAPEETMPAAMLRFIAQQVGAEPVDLLGYAERDQTRREHAVAMMREYGFTTFGVRDYRTLSRWLTEQARGTDNGLALVTRLAGLLHGLPHLLALSLLSARTAGGATLFTHTASAAHLRLYHARVGGRGSRRFRTSGGI